MFTVPLDSLKVKQVPETQTDQFARTEQNSQMHPQIFFAMMEERRLPGLKQAHLDAFDDHPPLARTISFLTCASDGHLVAATLRLEKAQKTTKHPNNRAMHPIVWAVQ